MTPLILLTCTSLMVLFLGNYAHAASPGFDCRKAQTPSAEAMICADAGLAALDRRMT